MEKTHTKSTVAKDLYKLALLTLENSNNKIAKSFHRNFPDIECLAKQKLEPSILPITDSILNVGDTGPSTSALVNEIKKSYLEQAWRQPYAIEDFGIKFFDNSAWFPIADVNGPILFSHGLMEIMLLGAELTYPKHKHSPEELYIVLAGKVWWEAENEKNSPSWKYAGDIIHHTPNQTHTITSGDTPVLILNLWRGGCFEMPEIV